jgi:nucleoside-diphosphate-sugar epimerase
VSIKQLADMVVGMLPTRVQHAPARAGDIAPAIVDSGRARRLLGWEPQVRFEQGLAELALAPVVAAHRNGGTAVVAV